MIDTYEAGEHNSMREPYIEYDYSSQKMSLESIERATQQSKKLRDKLEELHFAKSQVNLWENLE